MFNSLCDSENEAVNMKREKLKEACYDKRLIYKNQNGLDP
jgi:hypothetical protein